MTDDSAPTRGGVTQGDREAAAAVMPCNTLAECERVAEVKAGKWDKDYRVQAFSRHRLAAIEEAAKVADAAAAAKDGEPQFGGYARAEKNEAERIATAIRKLGETL